MNQYPKRIYSFGSFRLDEAERLLLREEKPVPITPKVFDLLLVLVKHQGRLLEKDELMRAVWPDAVVEEANLSANISILRKALGDGINGQGLIETVPKRGYRFVAPVREEDSGRNQTAGPEPSDSRMEGEEQETGAQEALISDNPRERAILPNISLPVRWRAALISWRLILVVLGFLLAAAWIAYRQIVQGGSTRITSLAVLPFKPVVEAHRDEAVEMGITESLKQAFVLLGGSLLMKAALGQAYATAGDKAEAVKILDELKTLSQQRYVPSSEIAAIYVCLGEREQAFHWLRNALEERAFHLIYIKARPEFDLLHSDPRFADLLRRIGLEK